jgi:hypothetical protein
MKRIFVIIAGVMLVTISSCSKKPDTGGTSAQKVANEWWVTFTVGGVDVYNLGYTPLVTFNTSANNGDIWIDDEENTYEYKVKAQVDYSALTFKAAAATNEYGNWKATITDGKILLNAAKSKTGNVTDSINFKVIFSDDPGTTYTVAGHARTRFSEDDY